MITHWAGWVICAVLAAAIYATRRLVHHPGDRHQPRSLAAATLPAREQTVPRVEVDGGPPWAVSGAGWAGGHAPDPETAWLVHQAERPVIWTADRDVSDEDMAAFRAAFRAALKKEASCASGYGPATDAEPLAPLPPEPRPARLPASATSARTATVPTSPGEPLADRYARLVGGNVPAGVREQLGHGGPREEAVDAALDSIFSKDMAQQVREMAASDG
jgi:hypothetical protein